MDAISLDGCGHAFCRGCILRHASESKVCPVCDITMHHTDPSKAMRHDQLLCDLIYLMVPDLMERERHRRNAWVDPKDQIVGLNLAVLRAFVLLPKRHSEFKFEGIMKFAIDANVGHIKVALVHELNKRRHGSQFPLEISLNRWLA